MSTKYLDENGVKILWNKTKEKIAEVDTKVDEIQSLSADEINEILNPVRLFTLRISNTEYQFEEGMTWKDWCASEYSNGLFYVDDNTDMVYYHDNTSILYRYKEYEYGSYRIYADVDYHIY